mgnify:CR=1 FL=1
MYENWNKLTLFEQLGNAGSDYERAMRWRVKGQEKMFEDALARTLEQIDLTLVDSRWTGPKRREIARLREEVCSEMLERNDLASAGRLQKYFLAFATVARQRAGL